MIKPSMPSRVIETINVNGQFLADRRRADPENTLEKQQLEAYERRQENLANLETSIDIWV